MVQSHDYCQCDEGEIKNLSHRYAVALDRNDFEEWKEKHMEAKHWYCRMHDRVSNSIANTTAGASNEKLMPL